MVAAFKERLKEVNPHFITFDTLKTLQVNLGDLCNLNCCHCHVNASARGKKVMGRDVMEKIVSFLSQQGDVILDITGGCPEMNPDFRFLIERTDGVSPRRIVRSNLTIMTEPGMGWLPEFYGQHGVVITASLPCYLEENVDKQRGKEAYGRSMAALKELNRVGYGKGLELNLVYNPGGEFIPGSQKELEIAYKSELFERFGIIFNNLYCITNAPIGRFREYLETRGGFDRYLHKLATSFNPDAAGNIMCRSLVSVDWRGVAYNCDFNQALELPIIGEDGTIMTIDDLEKGGIAGKELVLSQHCYSCTAGAGSSCTGTLAA